MRNRAIVMRSTNSMIGTARNRGYRSAGLSWFGIDCTWKRDNSHQVPSTLRLGAVRRLA